MRWLLIGICFLMAGGLSGSDWKKVGGGITADAAFRNINGHGSFSRTFEVTPGRDYLFSAEIQSNAAVTVCLKAPEIGGSYWKRMAYNDTGKKQRVMGFYNSRSAAKLEVLVDIQPLGAGRAFTELQNVTLEEVNWRDLQPVRRSDISGVTRLDGNACIVIPADRPQMRQWAEKISARIPGAPRILTDSEVCEKDYPVLKKEFADHHLIILGNLNTNRAIWPAYTNSLAASDTRYPGGDGYEVRTAVDVLSNGRNHIIIGGSNERGVERGVERFLERFNPELPFLLDVELGGDCKKAVEADIQKWRKFPNGSFPPSEPGYGTVRRWYHNVIAYYWTGDEFYRDMARKLFQPVLKDKAYTHHYIMEWLVLTWRMVGNTDLYTEAEKNAAEGLLLQNYLEFQTGDDLYWMLFMTPPYEKLLIASRHVTSPLMCQIELSNYLRRNYQLPEPLKSLADFTWDESSRAMRGIIMSRTQDSVPGGYAGGLEEFVLASQRFALKFNCPEYFLTDQARRSSQIEFMDPSDPRLSIQFRQHFNYKLICSVLSSYYRDPVLKYLVNINPANMIQDDMFNDRYICGIGMYQNDISALRPTEFDRVQIMPTSKHDLLHVNRYNFDSNWRVNPAVLKQNPVDMVIFRSGMSKEDALLGLAGAKKYIAKPGEITTFAAKGHRWLHNGWTGLYYNTTGLPFERNMLYVNRRNQPADAAGVYSALGSLDWHFERDGKQEGSMTVTPFNGIEWKRQVYRLTPDTFLVHDQATALVDDYYDLAVIWRPMQKAVANEPDMLKSSAAKHAFNIALAGKEFALETNTADYLAGLTTVLNSRFAFHGNLKKGETRSAYALLQVDSEYRLCDLGGGRVAVVDNGQAMTQVAFGNDGIVENSGEIELPGTAAMAAAAFEIPASERNYHEKWSWNGLNRPARIPVNDAPTIRFDLGEVVKLAELRSPMAFAKIPEQVMISSDNKTWQPLKLSPQWAAGQRCGNYGETHPVAEYYQYALLPDVEARYVKCDSPQRLYFYRSDRQVPRRPLKIISTAPDILVANEIYKSWPRHYQRDETAFSLLNSEGKELFNYDSRMGAHELKVLDYPQAQSIGLVNADGSMHFFDRNGQETATLDSYQALKEFHSRYGRSNTRQPAGGFAAIYAIGSWRGGDLIGTRYGQLSFFDAKGGLTGILKTGSELYSLPHILDRGVDFNGDGEVEQLVLGTGYLVHVDGKVDSRVRSPGSHIFWPEVFKSTQVRLPMGWDISLGTWGPKVYVFKVIHAGKQPYAVVISRTYLGIYDGKNRKFVSIWLPLAPVNAADIVQTGNRWLAAVSQDDGMISIMEWRTDPAKMEVTARVKAGDEINAICIRPRDGRIFAAGNHGVYEVKKFGLARIAAGAFTDVKAVDDGLITAGSDGKITYSMED